MHRNVLVKAVVTIYFTYYVCYNILIMLTTKIFNCCIGLVFVLKVLKKCVLLLLFTNAIKFYKSVYVTLFLMIRTVWFIVIVLWEKSRMSKESQNEWKYQGHNDFYHNLNRFFFSSKIEELFRKIII